MDKIRCAWCTSNPLYIAYHDQEWGVPVYDDRKLFEMLVLEGTQAGLSWLTVLKKRENYRQAFDQFDPEKVARYDEAHFRELQENETIIRNRLKIASAIRNAQGIVEIQKECGSFARFIWQYVDYAPRQNQWASIEEIPATTAESTAMSKDLKMRGFTFVGPIICYAFMQAVGMVNDHTTDCFRHDQIKKTAQSFPAERL